ncbi:MAG: acetate kinase [Blastocatellia bacterium]|jgi:acetate kinase|nr:acetate kinase [Blastocatellia bacterium]
MNILVLNCGSSSLKFQLFAVGDHGGPSASPEQLAGGMVDRIGGNAIISLQAGAGPARKSTAPLRDHRAAIDLIINWASSAESGIEGITSIADIHAVGHRIVHGGEQFKHSVQIDKTVIRGIEDCIELAPLHNPANLKGIEAATAMFGPGLPQVAVFDTSFHHTLPDHAFLYAIPYQLYRRYRLRRYGFHGTSHRFVTSRYQQLLGKTPPETKIITLHLGNGCSAAAILAGKSVDTSMGLTPLEGLVMGTRSGDLDPAILDFIASKEGLSSHSVESMLNTQSGLLGISGLTNDMRDLLDEARENGDRRARLAVEIFCYRASKYIGAYLAAMNGADAIIFTGGIGENSPEVRRGICANLTWMGIELDDERNAALFGGKEGLISVESSRVKVFVIPTNEELMIAIDTTSILVQ